VYFEEAKTELTASRILFENRRDAGRKLALQLASYASPSTVVLSIPNGGVPIGMEIAASIGADLDIIVCRKLASPLNPEGGLGAVADDGTVVINDEIIKRDGLTREQIEFELESVKQTVRQRRLKYKGNLPSSRLTGKTAIIVDDGLASGITMNVAVESARHRLAGDVVVAVPVASAAGYRRVAQVTDKIVTCAVANMSRFFLADFFRVWRDISDDEVIHYLDQWKKRVQF